MLNSLPVKDHGQFSVIGPDGVQRDGTWEQYQYREGDRSIRLKFENVSLTLKQLHILCLVERMSYKKAGEQLGLSGYTVSNTLRTMENKNGLSLRKIVREYGLLAEGVLNMITKETQQD